MSKRPSSMRDVARRAGVSLSTVSRVLRCAPGVAPEVRERVRRSADELSYVVSRNASGLVTGRTGRVAAVVPSLEPWFFGAVLSGVGEALHRSDLDMLVYQVDLRDRAGSLPLPRNSDAVITVALDLAEEECRLLDRVGVPLVLTGQRVPGRACVFVDNRAGTAAATRHLLNLGHTRIAYIGSRTGSHISRSSRDRLAGHESVMGEAGIRPWTVLKPSGYEGGELAVGELLSGQTLPTAVLAESDDMALGVHRALRRSGIAIPDAISLMGFGNRDVTEVLDLTTVDQAPRDIGVEAGLLTADILEETRPFDTHVELPTQIIPRRSTAAPKETRESSS